MPPSPFEPIHVPDWVWNRETSLDALRRRDAGALFEIARQYGGASQTRIGIATGHSQGRISDIMNGGRGVRGLAVWQRIADGLNMPRAARSVLGVAGPSVDPADSHQPPPRSPARTRNGDASVSDAAGDDDVAVMQSFRAADLQVGGGHLYANVVHYLHRQLAPRLFGSSAGPTVEVFAAGGGLTEMAGWMAHDAGRDETAARHFARAHDLAAISGDHQLQAHVLSSRSHLANHCGKPEDAIRYARSGRQALEAGPPNPALLARLCTMEARSFARMRNPAACLQLLRRAEKEIEFSTCYAPSEWVSNFDEGSFASEAARCMRHLSQFTEARTQAERIIALRKGRARSHAFGKLALATVLVTQRNPEVEKASELADDVLEATQSLASFLVLRELEDMGNLLRPYRSNRIASDLVDKLDVRLKQRLKTHNLLDGTNRRASHTEAM